MDNVAEPGPHTRLLDAAEELFYARGVQAVGMDEIRARAGVSLKRLYQLFPSKEALVEAFLERRDIRWRARLSAHVARSRTPQTRILAVYDWLALWFGEPDFRGCAWININGELGATSDAIREQTRRHKDAFRDYLSDLVAAAALPVSLADQLYLLAEGAMVTAGIYRTSDPAAAAHRAAEVLLLAHRVRTRRRAALYP
jgi:AcrR family transcriptional regulator